MSEPILKPLSIYCRVSTVGQAEKGTSLETQEAVCREKLRQVGRELYRVYKDAGVSGTLFQSRADLQDALRDIEAGKSGGLIVANFSRYSRDMEHQTVIKKRVQAAGGVLIFCDFDYSPTPEGDLFFGFQGVISQYEAQLIKKRTKDGKQKRAMGDPASGIAGTQPMRIAQPYALRIVTKADVLMGKYAPEMEGTYQVKPVEAGHVAQMFLWRAANWGYQKIADQLNADSVPVPRAEVKCRKRAGWNRATIAQILENPLYKGEAYYGRYQTFTDENRLSQGKHIRYSTQDLSKGIRIPCPAIVSEALWRVAQTVKQENGGRAVGNPNVRYLLSGLVQCPWCGDIATADGGKPTRQERNPDYGIYAAYRCFCSMKQGAHEREKPLCSRTRYDAPRLEAMVLAAVDHVLSDPANVAALIRGAQEAAAIAALSTAPSEREAIAEEDAALVVQERRLVDAQLRAIEAGASSLVYEEKLAGVTLQRKALAARLSALQVTSGIPLPAHTQADCICQVLSFVSAALSDPEVDKAERNRILRGVVAKVVPIGGDAPGGPITRLSRKMREAGKAKPDSAWVVLRDVYAETVENRGVSVKSVSILVTVPAPNQYECRLSLTLPLLPFEGGTP